MSQNKIFIQILTVVFLLFVGIVNGRVISSVSAQSVQDIQNSINALQSQNQQLESQINNLDARKSSDMNSLVSINSLISQEGNTLNAIKLLLSSLGSSLGDYKSFLNNLEDKRNQAFKLLYINTQENPFELFLSSSEFSTFAVSWGENQSLLNSIKKKIITTNSEIVTINNELSFQKSQSLKLQNDLAYYNAQVGSISNDIAFTNSSLSNIAGLQQGIAQKIAQLQQEKLAASSVNSSPTPQTTTVKSVSQVQSQVSDSNTNVSSSSSSSPYIVSDNCNSSCGNFSVSVGGQSFNNVSGPIDINPQNIGSPMSVNNISYLGADEIRADTNSQFINILPLEDYLQGIGEMSASWQPNALESQVIAARTYALYHMGEFSSENYDLQNGTVDQSYVGYSKNEECIKSNYCNWEDAVSSTNGDILTYNGGIIDSVYAASNGGYNLSDSEVWGGSAPYLQSGEDSSSTENYNSVCNGTEDFNYAWFNNVTLTPSQIAIIINDTNYFENSTDSTAIKLANLSNAWWNAPAAYDIASSSNISSLSTDVSSTGPVASENTTVVFTNQSGTTYSLDAQDFAFVYNTVTPYGYYIQIPSLNYTIGQSTNNKSELTVNNYFALYTITGNTTNGFQINSLANGFRLGLSQCGAEGRALDGQNYTQILSAYYPGTSISNYQSSVVNIRVGIMGGSISSYNITPTSGFSIYANGTKIYSSNNSQQVVINQL